MQRFVRVQVLDRDDLLEQQEPCPQASSRWIILCIHSFHAALQRDKTERQVYVGLLR